jgi:hypothetical protein
LDAGVATINQSCGIQSAPVTDTRFWTFSIAAEPTTAEVTSTTTLTTSSDQTTAITPEETTTTTTPEEITTTTTPEETTITAPAETIIATPGETTTTPVKTTTITPVETTPVETTTIPSNPVCSEWFLFDTIKNITTSESQQNYSFCFYVNTTFADVTISANTWAPCATWKISGTADPLIDFYNITNNSILLAQNDDGNSIPELNCYAAVISYRLYRGNYRVVIRHLKCNYGRFEVRLSAETTNPFK